MFAQRLAVYTHATITRVVHSVSVEFIIHAAQFVAHRPAGFTFVAARAFV